MDSSFIERPGKWRAAGVVLFLLLAAIPPMPLAWRALAAGEWGGAVAGASFPASVSRSVLIAALVAAASFTVGLPAGVITALEALPGRRVLLSISMLPLLVPSFLWAIGWSRLAVAFGTSLPPGLSAYAGVTIVFATASIPLVLLVAHRTASALGGSQVDAARLAGGEAAAFLSAARHAAIPSLLAALLGGALTLSDPGPGQIFGLHGAASEILTSFSSRNDFGLAGRQCIALAGVAFLLTAPLVFLTAPRLAAEVLARQTRTLGRGRSGGLIAGGIAFFALFLLTGIVLPLGGLGMGLVQEGSLARALDVVRRTGADTLVYAAGAGGVAVVLGFGVAFFVGRDERLRRLSLAVSLALFSLPPALGALGIIALGTQAPAWADPFLRSRGTVCAALGIRYSPIAVLIGLRAWGAMPSSWALAASIHGLHPAVFLGCVALPNLLPGIAAAFLLVALLATADVSTVLLLHPPGESSFPLSIFTVMANAPESLVASLCLLYIVGAAGILVAAMLFLGVVTRSGRRRGEGGGAS